MKKTLLILTLLLSWVYAKPTAPRMGCILSQQGEVTSNWTIYGDEKLGREGNSTQVNYTAIKKEGENFNEILVGSTIQVNMQDKKILAKIVHIQSKKRIKRGPRHGVIVLNITLNGVSKDIPTVYFYETGDMKMKGYINLKDFKLSDKDSYTELAFGLQIHSIVCALPDRSITK